MNCSSKCFHLNKPLEIEFFAPEPKYLYRAVDSNEATIDFVLSANRNVRAAKRFFKKSLSSEQTQAPRVITVDKNPTYPAAVEQ
jgi:IS6 family transposase